MNIQTIHEHSVDLDLLSGGICIDVGCRGFLFSGAMRDKGLEVWAMDIEFMLPPNGIRFVESGLSNYDGVARFVNTKDLQAKHLFPSEGSVGDSGTECMVKSLPTVYKMIGRVSGEAEIDVLKCDIEGSEYLVLSDPNFQPLPKQISIEFHMHCHRALHDQYYDKCMENLLKWYVPVKHELTEAHGAGLNFWDSLFIRKDLL